MEAPRAKRKPFTHIYHNQKFIDNYYWLRDKENEEVTDYLTAENQYTKEVMGDTKDLQEGLYEEIKARIKEDDQSVPVFEDGYFYYTRTEKGEQYAIHCRKKESLDAEEEVLLDENILAKGKDYFSLGDFAVSPNNKLLAYSYDDDGSEQFNVFVLNLETREHFLHTIENSYYGLEWSNDSNHLFYTKLDESHRPYQLWCHNIHKPSSADLLTFQEDDDAFFVEVGKTKDNQYILLNISSQVTSEIHYLSADIISEGFSCIAKRESGVEYEVDHYKGEFHILTNDQGAKNFQWKKTTVGSVGKAKWEEVLAYDPEHYLLELEVFDKYFVLEERYQGQKQLRVFSSDFKKEEIIHFNEDVYDVAIGNNPEFEIDMLRLHYRSMITPRTTYDYDMARNELHERKVQEIPSGYNKGEYATKRIFVAAHDGEQIPVSIMYKKSLLRNEGNPLYLYAYGSYGINVDPYFSIAQLSLVNRGFIFAIAHIRGGSDKGRGWYENGKFLQKKNTFLDFISVAQHFIEEKYTTPQLLVANGGSAGGLLMGAVANMAGDLFQSIIADVPFVDVINTMMDESLPLTVVEYDEWGNPNNKKYFDYMLSYSPYNNLEKKEYPNLLVTAGLNDPRVQYWEPAKWVAKLRTTKTDENLLLLKTNMDAGHAGVSGRFDKIKEVAFEFAFILKTIDHLDLK